MQIETRTSNFDPASCHKKLDGTDKAKNYLEVALNESNMSIGEFVTGQYFQDEQTCKCFRECVALI
tara:strand:- start:610 stop:807 length:198 start_codon:yes stop_codon:yes gene_type:complete